MEERGSSRGGGFTTMGHHHPTTAKMTGANALVINPLSPKYE